MQYTILQINNRFKNTLKKLYSNAEIQQITFLVFEKLLGFSKIYVMTHSERMLSQNEDAIIRAALHRLLNQEPIQYIVGETEFYNLLFKVNSAVLIPRPETEELVHWILGSLPVSDMKILDIGTGSGCIAIALAKNITKAQVHALDVSKKALDTAGINARNNKVDVNFIEHDILQDSPDKLPHEIDILVSNPPYIRQHEKTAMKNNVLNYEPDVALFVSDNDPLIFYKQIAITGREILNKQGTLFFEINEALGADVKQMLAHFKYSKIEIRKDLYGKDRMIKANY